MDVTSIVLYIAVIANQNIYRMSFGRKFRGVICLLALPFALAAQKEVTITLINPSFEDVPKDSEAPTGWYDCGKSGESPPDVQPGSFSVTKAPSHGNTYLGLVVRDNETWEGVAQRLSRPLEKDQCYEFTMDMCRAELYLSTSKVTGKDANYATPAKLRVYGGTGYCNKTELLYETAVVTNTRWLSHTFRLHPKNGNYSFLLIEAYYKTPVLFPYNGNILIDNASPIKQIVCGPEKMPETKPSPPIAVATKSVPKDKPKTQTKLDTQSKKNEPVKPTAAVIERKTVRKGRTYRLDKVYFDANKYEIKDASESELGQLYDFLRTNTDVVVEVGGHTNNAMWPDSSFANQLSTNRARAVANWLISKGISADRVLYKGYGWTKPIEPNITEEGRRKNQRVEITILNMNG